MIVQPMFLSSVFRCVSTVLAALLLLLGSAALPRSLLCFLVADMRAAFHRLSTPFAAVLSLSTAVVLFGRR